MSGARPGPIRSLSRSARPDPSPFRFSFSPSSEALEPVRGLSAAYYANASWEGTPVLTAIDRSVHFEKSALVRRAAELVGPASAVWEGVLSVPAQSVYRFELVSDDGSTLELDGRLLIDNGGFHPSRRAVRDILLARGDHPSGSSISTPATAAISTPSSVGRAASGPASSERSASIRSRPARLSGPSRTA